MQACGLNPASCLTLSYADLSCQLDVQTQWHEGEGAGTDNTRSAAGRLAAGWLTWLAVRLARRAMRRLARLPDCDRSPVSPGLPSLPGLPVSLGDFRLQTCSPQGILCLFFFCIHVSGHFIS